MKNRYSKEEIRLAELTVAALRKIEQENNGKPIKIDRPPPEELKEVDPIVFYYQKFCYEVGEEGKVTINMADRKIVSITAESNGKKVAFIEVTKEMRKKSSFFGDSPLAKLIQSSLKK